MKKCIVHAHIIIMQGNWPISIQIKTHWSPLGWISHLRLKDISFKIIELETRYSWELCCLQCKIFNCSLCVFSTFIHDLPMLKRGFMSQVPSKPSTSGATGCNRNSNEHFFHHNSPVYIHYQLKQTVIQMDLLTRVELELSFECAHNAQQVETNIHKYSDESADEFINIWGKYTVQYTLFCKHVIWSNL